MYANTGAFAQADDAAVLARGAEDCGFESLWTVEHVIIPETYESVYPYNRKGRLPEGIKADLPDPVVWMTYVAALTSRIRLSTGILILPQRHPLYVAKEFASLDRLSGGRAMMGVGIGWLEEEFDALGIDFRARAGRTDEAIAGLRALWQDGPSSFDGRHFRWQAVHSSPKPVQPTGVPIIVGGHSLAAARRAARLGDGFFPGRIDRLDELLTELRAEAQRVGRDPDSIEVTTGTPDLSLDNIKAMADKGISRLILPPPGQDKTDIRAGLERFAENVISRL